MTRKKRQEIHREADLTQKATAAMRAELDQAARRLDEVLAKLKRRAAEGRPLLRLARDT
jgi:hypothetical protein